MVYKFLLFVALLGGVVFFIHKILNLLFPKVFKSSVSDFIRGFAESGKKIINHGESLLDEIQSFLNNTQVPFLRTIGSQDIIKDAKEAVESLKKFLVNPDIKESGNVLNFLLSTVTPDSSSILRDFKKGNLFVLTDDADHPFQITSLIAETAEKLVKNRSIDEDKARAIYDWIEGSIRYGERRRGKNGYRTAAEVMQDGEGVCGEMAVLNVVMNRSVGLKSNYVSVTVDFQGKDVLHACSSILINGNALLSDPAYHTFGIRHKRYKILPDAEAVEHFKRMRVR